MLACVYDTETAGIFNWRLPANHPDQPDVLQLCAMLADETRVYSMFNVYIHADTPIPKEAFEVHRIDREMTSKVGISRKAACILLASYLKSADVIVGHNIDFDIGIMRTAMLREGGDGRLLNKTSYCTMKNSTDIVQIPHPKPKRPGEFKWPSLQEAYKKLVDPRGFEGAHDAFADVTATYDVYKVLRQGTNAGV